MKKLISFIKELGRSKYGAISIAATFVVFYLCLLLLGGNSNVFKLISLSHKQDMVEKELYEVRQDNEKLSKRIKLLKQGDEDLLDELSRKKLNEAPKSVYILKIEE